MKAKITSKGQITIPVEVRRRLRLNPGQILDFDENAPFLKAVKVFDPGKMYATIGCSKKRVGPAKSADEWLTVTRGEVELPGDKNANRD